MKSSHLDHIAIAVKDIENTKKVYEDLGFEFEDHLEIVEEQKVKTAFAKIEGRSKIELLEPTADDSPIAKYIDKKGEGIHHICFRVDSVEEKSIELKDKGYKLIYEQAKLGAGNCLVNFVHPKTTGGVLIEISQKLED